MDHPKTGSEVKLRGHESAYGHVAISRSKYGIANKLMLNVDVKSLNIAIKYVKTFLSYFSFLQFRLLTFTQHYHE